MVGPAEGAKSASIGAFRISEDTLCSRRLCGKEDTGGDGCVERFGDRYKIGDGFRVAEKLDQSSLIVRTAAEGIYNHQYLCS